MSVRIADGTKYMAQIQKMLLEYTERLGRDLEFQNIEEELGNPAQKYAPPAGNLLVALDEHEKVLGMVAYHRHSKARCEMKRLYVSPACRGKKVGERLVTSIMQSAREAGFKEMVLDTLEPLHAAVCLYKKMGFCECAAYYHNPMSDVIYMKKFL